MLPNKTFRWALSTALLLALLWTVQLYADEVVYLNEASVTFSWPTAPDHPEFYNVYVSDNGSQFFLVGRTKANSYTFPVENQHTYSVKIQSADFSGGVSPVSDPAGPFKVVLTEIPPLTQQAPPKESGLLPNYPNPFNPETWIPYQLSSPAEVAITIYNARGEHVRSLNLGYQSAGSYIDKASAAYWDGRTELGEAVASGVYYYAIRTSSGFSSARKMVVMK
jgi:hypothetical protein